MNILLLGGSGQVGFELQRTLSAFGQLHTPNTDEIGRDTLDPLKEILSHGHYDLIVNAAAWTAVDKAEDFREAAFRANAELPGLLADYARQHDIPLIHYSSDYVYKGDGSEFWVEESETGPLSVYGESKLAGDQAIEKSGCAYFIFRTSWVYSARGHNFVKTMLMLGESKPALSIVGDQIGAPTPARLIAQVTTLAIYSAVKGNAPWGTYHLAPQGAISWHEFALEIFKYTEEKKYAELSIKIKDVKGIPTSEYPTPATRPLNSRLDVKKIENALSIQMPDWKSQLHLTVDEIFIK